jgi:hypothetical protein
MANSERRTVVVVAMIATCAALVVIGLVIGGAALSRFLGRAVSYRNSNP